MSRKEQHSREQIPRAPGALAPALVLLPLVLRKHSALAAPIAAQNEPALLPAWHRAAGTLEQAALVDDRHVAAGSVRFCCDECSEWKNWRGGSAPFSRLLGAGCKKGPTCAHQ